MSIIPIKHVKITPNKDSILDWCTESAREYWERTHYKIGCASAGILSCCVTYMLCEPLRQSVLCTLVTMFIVMAFMVYSIVISYDEVYHWTPLRVMWYMLRYKTYMTWWVNDYYVTLIKHVTPLKHSTNTKLLEAIMDGAHIHYNTELGEIVLEDWLGIDGEVILRSYIPDTKDVYDMCIEITPNTYSLTIN